MSDLPLNPAYHAHDRRHHRMSGAFVASAHDFDTLPAWDRYWRRVPIVDRETGSWSITRTIALYFAFEAGDVLDEHKTSLNMAVALVCVSLALIAGCMAFGKSTMGFLLSRLQVSAMLGASTTSTATFSSSGSDLLHGVVKEAKAVISEHTETKPAPAPAPHPSRAE